MNSKLVKASSALTLFVLMASVVATNAPAFAVNGHGIHVGPQFGAGPYMTYNDGLKINGATFDISKYSTTTNTQNLYVNEPSDITLKIFLNTNAKLIQHVIVFLNIQGDNPQSYQTNTHIDWDKNLGVSTSDPNGFFNGVTTSVKYDGQLMYITFHVVPAKPMDTSHMIIKAWDSNLSAGQVIIKNVIKFGYIPNGFSSTSQ
jgi:hypothetical protein